jgi:Ca-activated chloride channel homolog
MANCFKSIRFTSLISACLILLMVAGLTAGVKQKGKPPAKEQAKPLAAPQQNQEEPKKDFEIKVAVDLVTTDVLVIGTPVTEPVAEDFLIMDNEDPQEVDYFSKDQLPLAIALVVDASESIRPYLPMLQLASYMTLRHLKPEDEVSLYSFNSSRLKLCDLTTDRIQIGEKIGKIKIALGTNLFGTVYDAVSYLKSKAPYRRRAIILVSDNCHVVFDGDNYHGKSSCHSELLGSNTLLYNIRTPGDNMGAYSICQEADTDVQWLAEQSGGEVMFARNAAAIPPALDKVITNLRKQYTIGFNPSNPGEKGSFHKLTVKFKSENLCPGCRVLVRNGYYSGVSQPLPPAEKKAKVKIPLAESFEKMDEILIQRSIFTAGAFSESLPGITFNVTTNEIADPSGLKQIKVDLKIRSTGIQFKKIDDKYSSKLRIAIFYADQNGNIIGSDWKKMEGLLSEDNYKSILRAGYSYSANVPKKVDNQMLKIVVFDEESNLIGTDVLIVP